MIQKFVSLLLLCLFFLNQSLALIVVDVDTFHFASTDGRQGIRVTQFDTDKQKFLALDYFVFSMPPSSDWKKEILGITFDSKGNVKMGEGLDLKKHLIRSVGKITAQGKDFYKSSYTDGDLIQRNIITNSPLLSKNGEEILKLAQEKSKKTPERKNFQATFHDQPGKVKEDFKSFSNLSAVQNENSKERGRLGELVTELTMLSWDYYPKTSKYEANHGNDGIFENKSLLPTLFLTESKCRQESASPKIYMKSDLSEKRIYEKLHRMKRSDNPSVKQTAALIEKYIYETPQRLLKLVQRIKSDGTAQLLVEPFNSEEYRKALPPLCESSSRQEKIEAVSCLLKRLASSEEEKLALVLESLHLTPLKASKIIEEIKKEKAA